MTLEQPTALALLNLHGVEIVDTFAEAFPIKAARLVMTAINERWAKTAATVFCGNATSVIACDVEAAIERDVSAKETPDGRPGVAVLVFGFTTETLATAIQARVGQCVLTCPTTACYNGISDCPKEKRIRIGGGIRYFGDGFQKSKKLGDQRFWRIPVMDGEFLVEETAGVAKGIGGGNFIVQGRSLDAALDAARRAVAAIEFVEQTLLQPSWPQRSRSRQFALAPMWHCLFLAELSVREARSGRGIPNSRPVRMMPTAPRFVHWSNPSYRSVVRPFTKS